MSVKAKKDQDEPRSGYFYESARPLTSLIFILPMLLAYEGALIGLGADAVHNGVADWLQNVLDSIGIGNFVLLPVITCALLLGWHYMQRHPWKVSGSVFIGMLVECVIWAAMLWLVFQGWSRLVGGTVTMKFNTAQLFGFLGAGIYEELLFRLLLLSGVAAIVQTAGAPRRASLTTGILVSAVLFAACHYAFVAPGGLKFSWAGITFHTLCGVLLGVLFTQRGFGITAGTHALYNILVMVLKL